MKLGMKIQKLNVLYPNLPAAICLSNRAAVYLEMKNYNQALKDA